MRLLAASLLILQVTACSPSIVKEPYPVEVVREVVIPQPREYTDPLPTPTLPQGELTCQHLADGWLEWAAFGKTANEHRAAVKKLSKGQ